ncbi:TIGR01906 family membrane protein [Acidaminobacter sp.]|uniref:TIGR01906 family membrane protein n=1 Tax=Acidaminobacter sp. TaxID=1872102 RepID=UPI00137D7AB1|nr:TIGR01906 family membrane protein [Acidaminobacter sp.]MDK9710894.1 TIGR01906 family membrane protein [Acidaminobacter sp.]MZQ98357.1 TIGR01906 family membrane protein [Acidaminobacter sp.]
MRISSVPQQGPAIELPSAAKWLLVLIMAVTANLFILSLSIDVFSMSRSYYDQEFEKLGTTELTGLTAEELGGVSDMIIGYLKGQEPEFQFEVERNGRQVQLFNDREQTHMVDVLVLFQLNGRIKMIAIAAFALSAFVALQLSRDRALLYRGLIGAGVLGIAAAGFLLLLITIDFTKYFTLFHELFFDNDLWLLNPKTDLLIVILQEQFFVDIAIRIFGLYIGLNVVLVTIGTIFLRSSKRAGRFRRA